MLSTPPPVSAAPPVGANPAPMNNQSIQGLGAPGIQSHPLTNMIPGLNTAGVNPMVAALRGGNPSTPTLPPQAGGVPGGMVPPGLGGMPSMPPQAGGVPGGMPPGMLGQFPPGFSGGPTGSGLGATNNPWIARP